MTNDPKNTRNASGLVIGILVIKHYLEIRK